MKKGITGRDSLGQDAREEREDYAEKKKGPILRWTLYIWCGWQESNPRPLGS